MTDKTEYLNRIAQMRADYRDFVAAVEADLAREKQLRLLARQSEIREAVVEAFAVGGARIEELKRAYGTKDYRTIKNILDGATEEIAAIQAVESQVSASREWFTVDPPDMIIIWEGDWTSDFTIEFMDEGAIMLIGHDPVYPNGFESAPNPVVKEWDGEVLLPTDTGRKAEIYKAVTT